MIEENRRTGRTTRLVDKAIQDLFTNGKIVFKDYRDENSIYITEVAMRIKRRLDFEHKLVRDSTFGRTKRCQVFRVYNTNELEFTEEFLFAIKSRYL